MLDKCFKPLSSSPGPFQEQSILQAFCYYVQSKKAEILKVMYESEQLYVPKFFTFDLGF